MKHSRPIEISKMLFYRMHHTKLKRIYVLFNNYLKKYTKYANKKKEDTSSYKSCNMYPRILNSNVNEFAEFHSIRRACFTFAIRTKALTSWSHKEYTNHSHWISHLSPEFGRIITHDHPLNENKKFCQNRGPISGEHFGLLIN
jgi:hypothetical protein